MPAKTAFKRSLLNSQPLPPIEQRSAVKNLTDAATSKDGSGFDVASLGFSDFIERQVNTLRDSPDAVALNGVQDSNAALTVSTDPQRPELILLTRLFENSPTDVREMLRLRGFEACLDEADYQQFLALLMSSKTIAADFEKRYKAANDARVESSSILDGLAEIVSTVDTFRDSSDFLLNSSKIHLAAVKYLAGYPARYRSSTETWRPTLLRTFAGLNESLELSNSSLVATLMTSLALPGSIRYEVSKGNDRQKGRFLVPRVSQDPVSQLLAKISQIDVTLPDGFARAESLLPPDPSKRIALIAEALSYELSVSVGLQSLKQKSISSYLVEKVGITSSPLLNPPPTTAYASVIRSGDTLPLESKDYVIDGNTYKGSLSSFVDPVVESGQLNFSGLSDYSKKFTNNLSLLISDIKKLRQLDDQDEGLSSVSLIKKAAETVLNGTNSLVTYAGDSNFDSLDKKQLAQFAYLKALASSDTGEGSLDPKYKSFMKFLVNQDFALDVSSSQSESPSASSPTRSAARSTSSETKTSSVAASIKSSKSDENREISTEVQTSESSGSKVSSSAANVTAGTAGGLKAGVQVSSLLGSSSKFSGLSKGSSTSRMTSTSKTSAASVSTTTSESTTSSYADLEEFESSLPPTDYYSGQQGSSYLDPYGSETVTDIESLGFASSYSVDTNDFAPAGISYATSELLGISSTITKTALSDISVEEILGESASSLLGSTTSFIRGMSSTTALDGSAVVQNVESSVGTLNLDPSSLVGSLGDTTNQLASLQSVGSDIASSLGGVSKAKSTIEDAFGALSTTVAGGVAAAVGSVVNALSFTTPKLDDSFNICDSSSPFLDIPLSLPKVSAPSLSLPNTSNLSSAAAGALDSLKSGLGAVDTDSLTTGNLPVSLSLPSVPSTPGISGLASTLEQTVGNLDPGSLSGAIVPASLASSVSQAASTVPGLSSVSSATSALSSVSSMASSAAATVQSVAGSVGGSISSLNVSSAGKAQSISNSAEKLLKSDDILGLSIQANGIQKYAKIMQKTTDVESISRLTTTSQNSSSRKSSESLSLSNITVNLLSDDGAAARSRATGQFGIKSRVYGKSTLPDTKAASSVSAEYSPYLAMFEPGSTAPEGQQFMSSLTGILNSLVEDSTSKNPLLTGSIRNSIKEILEIAGDGVGDKNAFISSTSCYGINRNMLEFLFYSMCLAILPSVTPISFGYVFATDRKDFDISCRIDTAAISSTVTLLDSVANLEGAVSDVLRSIETLRVDKSLFESLTYCKDCSDLVKERLAVVESYVNSYSTAVTNLTTLSSSKTVADSLKKLKDKQLLGVLNDITIESVSAAQLRMVNMRSPASLPPQPRVSRISERVVTLLLQDLSRKGSRNSAYLSVGLPAKSIEYLRRSPISEGEKDFEIEGKEYLELEFTKRDVQYSDLVMKKSITRFCPSLVAVPQMTRAKTLKEAAFDFVYLCYTGKTWETRGFAGAVSFVQDITGLSPAESVIVVYNHVFDSVGKLALMNLTGVNLTDGLTNAAGPTMNGSGADFFKKALMDQTVSPSIPTGTLLPGNYVLQSNAGYSVIPYSKLPPSVVTRTDEPSYRLLYTIAGDPMFTYENYYGKALDLAPFERIYMCLVDPDEFSIDKFATVSTPSGKSCYEGLVKTGKITESETVANLNDRELSGSLEGNEFAVKASLVTG